MATTPRSREIEYPTSDGKPMAETDVHRDNMADLIETLKARFADDPMAYVSGNLLVFYEEGNKRRHVAPDVFVVFGVPKRPPREHYLLWEEGKGPDVVIELTSKTTRSEDQGKKRVLYQDILKVPEYFLFDPNADWLKPPLQGFRRVGGEYAPIEKVANRLPSAVLGLHLERYGFELRLHDPTTGRRLTVTRERLAEAEAALRLAEARLERTQAARLREEAARLLAEADRKLTAAENERLRQEIEALRRQPPPEGA